MPMSRADGGTGTGAGTPTHPQPHPPTHTRHTHSRFYFHLDVISIFRLPGGRSPCVARWRGNSFAYHKLIYFESKTIPKRANYDPFVFGRGLFIISLISNIFHCLQKLSARVSRTHTFPWVCAQFAVRCVNIPLFVYQLAKCSGLISVNWGTCPATCPKILFVLLLFF